jgi:chromosome segregation ATPase
VSDRPKTLLDGFGKATEEVVALRAEVERLRGLNEATQQTLTALTAERDHYGAEVARLRAALERIAHTITRESATSQQAEHAWFIATFALKDQHPTEHAEPDADDGLAR